MDNNQTFEGLVTKSTGLWYEVLYDNKIIICRLKGKLKLTKHKLTNPVAVGDKVIFHFENELKLNGVILEIINRKNYLIRKSNKLSSQYQIIASNIDLIIILACINNPYTSLGFIDRILVTAEAYQIPTKIIYNKIDIYNDNDLINLNNVKTLYQNIGYTVDTISCMSENDINAFKKSIENKTILITGHSGVGKSTLINKCNPKWDIKIGEISKAHHKGKHNTTFAQMYIYNNSTFMIDTPGIKDFGLIEMEFDAIDHYFPEIFKAASNCKYSNCKHISEPECNVQNEIINQKIAVERYESYLSIIANK